MKKLLIFIFIILVFIIINMYLIGIHFLSYFLLDQPVQNKGIFDKEVIISNNTRGQAFIVFYTFVESLLLIIELHHQWHIESQFSMFRELLLVSIVWIVFTTLINAMWLFLQYDWSISWSTANVTIEQGKWCDYLLIGLRSMLCILISTAKNIY